MKYTKKNISGFIFDFDGTLSVPTIDFSVMRSTTINKIKELTNVTIKDDSSLPLVEILKTSCSSLPLDVAKKVGEIAYSTIKEVELEAAGRSSLFPFTLKIFNVLKKSNIPYAIATRNCLEALTIICPNIKDLCPIIIARDDVQNIKPHPEHFDKAMSLLKTPNISTISVGDSVLDIKAGRTANLITAAVASGETSYEKLLSENPDIILNNADELMQELKFY